MKNSVCYFFDRRPSEAEPAFRQAIGLTPNSLRHMRTSSVSISKWVTTAGRKRNKGADDGYKKGG